MEVESCLKKSHHQPDDRYGLVGGALSPYLPELGAHSGRHLGGSRACWTLSGFVGGYFSCCKWFTRSRNSAICRACSSCFASISWRRRRNWSSMGGFTGLLDMALSSNGPMGCLRMAKALEIGRSPGSGCTQALAYRL